MASLIIHKPSIEKENGRTILRYFISLTDGNLVENSSTLWFSFDEKYTDYICYEVCDPVVLVLLQYCLKGGYDIESDVPMTDRLYYEIISQYIPQMLLMNPSAHRFELRVKTICPDWKPTAVATAMSCGIDSLTTFYEYTGDSYPEGFRLTHLTFYEQGAHHGGGGLTWKEQDKIYLAQLKKVKSFCEQANVELIDVRSNLVDFFQTLLWHEQYDHTHTYRNMAITLLLQKLIRVYYYASTYNLDEFNCSLDTDAAHCEKWLLPTLSTSYTSFFSANSSLNRMEKIRFLADKPETYDHVLVCYKEGNNCGTCMKCWRTMLGMELCGVLDLYRGSFDVDEFRDHYDYYVTQMLLMRRSEPLMQEIYDYMTGHEIEIPQKCLHDARIIERKARIKNSALYSFLRRIKRRLKQLSR